jgi:hypothetical protein
MTPTEQDKELREQLLSLYSANFNDGEPIESRVGSRGVFSVSVIVDFVDDFIVPLVAADRKRVALEARIDEISHIFKIVDGGIFWQSDISLAMPLGARIAELKAQQEEV